MLILSVGMPRAGSGWYYNLQHDLITASGGQDARTVRQRYHLQKVLTEVNCNIGALTLRRLLVTLIPSRLGNTFVIKAHSAPTPLAHTLIRLGWMRTTYIYRDPRDAMLSAFENGQRALQSGRSNAFSHLVDFDSSLSFMHEYVKIGEKWLACPDVLDARYEDLLTNYEPEAQRLVIFLGLKHTDAVDAVLAQYQPAQAQTTEQQGLHFRKGKVGRFREKFSSEEQQRCMDAFGSFLRMMKYE
jgi:hypothetical protein